MLFGGYCAHRCRYLLNRYSLYVDPDGRFVFLAFAVISAGLTAYDTYQTYQNEGAGAAARSLAIDGAISLAGGSVLKVAGKAFKGVKGLLNNPCCFVAGTQVLTKTGYKNIEAVTLGEKLWAKNVKTGEQEWKFVTKIFIEPNRGIYEIKLKGEDGFEQKIEATNDHPFYVINQGWKKTIQLQIGDPIETDGHGAMAVTSVVDQKRRDLSYNFTVADFHTYYVTKRNILVHNCVGAKSERVRHFTNSKGAQGIKDSNIIKASDQNSVFTVKAKGNPGSPRDVEQQLGIGRGRANNMVEFDASPGEFQTIKNSVTSATERVFNGDVDLTGRNPTFKKNR